jgi:hypothetical protein
MAGVPAGEGSGMYGERRIERREPGGQPAERRARRIRIRRQHSEVCDSVDITEQQPVTCRRVIGRDPDEAGPVVGRRQLRTSDHQHPCPTVVPTGVEEVLVCTAFAQSVVQGSTKRKVR